jgi:pimeloyl-ACP methyl ester carboxylesterase
VGYGESDKPFAFYDRLYFSEWLFSFIRSLGLSRVYIVGHSVGGAIVLQLAQDHPETVGRMIIINAAGLGKGMLKVPNSIKLRMIWQNLSPSTAGSRYFLEQYGLFDPGKLKETMLDVEKYGIEVIGNKGGRRVFWLGRGRVVAPFSSEELNRIKCPTLILWGREDKNYPSSIAIRASETIHGAKLTLIPQAGYNCFYDQPELVAQSIIKFLRG